MDLSSLSLDRLISLCIPFPLSMSYPSIDALAPFPCHLRSFILLCSATCTPPIHALHSIDDNEQRITTFTPFLFSLLLAIASTVHATLPSIIPFSSLCKAQPFAIALAICIWHSSHIISCIISGPSSSNYSLLFSFVITRTDGCFLTHPHRITSPSLSFLSSLPVHILVEWMIRTRTFFDLVIRLSSST